MKNMFKSLIALMAVCICAFTAQAANFHGQVIAVAGEGGTVAANTSNSSQNLSYENQKSANSSNYVLFGSSATLNFYVFAKADAGYEFVGWSDSSGGDVLSSNNPYSVTVTATSTQSSNPTTKTVYAVFRPKVRYGRVTATVSEGSGTVAASITTTAGAYGDTASATNITTTSTQVYRVFAQSAEGWQFIGWSTTAGGAVSSSDNPLVVNVEATAVSSESPTEVVRCAHFGRPVARVAGTTYLSVAAAVAASRDGDTIEIFAACEFDLGGDAVKRNFSVVDGASLTIKDTSTDLTGKLDGTLTATNAGAFVLEAGRYTSRPQDEWTADNRIVLENYTTPVTWTVSRFEQSDALSDCTLDTRRGVRVVDDPTLDVLPLTYASGNWVHNASTNATLESEITLYAAEPLDKTAMGFGYAQKVNWHDGMTDLGVGATAGNDKSYTYPSENNDNLDVEIPLGPATLFQGPGEASQIWQQQYYGLMEVRHRNAKGEIIRAWYKYPEIRFDATQRDHEHAVKETYWEGTDNREKGKWEILISEQWLGSRWGWNRLTGTDEELTKLREKLDDFDPNGLRVWENYVLDLEPTKQLVTTATSADGKVTFDLPGPGKDAQYGYDVRYVLRRVADSWKNPPADRVEDAKKWQGWAEITERTRDHNFTIALNPDDHDDEVNASGLYHLWTLIIPNTAVAITNQIPSTNIIGVLKVNTACTNMITAVPWKHLSSDPTVATDVTVSEVVDASNLQPGDRLYVYDNANDIYYGYQMESTDGESEQPGFTKVKWTPMISVYRDGVYTSGTTRDTLPRGGTFWTVRQNPLDAGQKIQPYFVVGQHQYGTYTNSVKSGSYEAPASTMVANPTPNAVDLNALVFVGSIDNSDTIMVPNVNGNVTTPYVRKNGKWGTNKKSYVNGRLRSTFVEGCVIAPGTGFWYERRASGELKLVWPAWTEGDYRK